MFCKFPGFVYILEIALILQNKTITILSNGNALCLLNSSLYPSYGLLCDAT